MSKNFLQHTLIFPFLGIFIFTLSLVFAPITYNFNSESFLIIYGFYLFYILGWLAFYFALKNNVKLNCTHKFQKTYTAYFHKLEFLTTIFLYLTIIFLVLNVYDFFVVGDVLNRGIIALREERTLEGQRGSFVGFFIVLLSAVPLILMTLTYLLAKEKRISNKLFYYFIAYLGVFAYLLSGGRNNFFLAIIFFIIFSSIVTHILRVKKQRYMVLKKIFLMSLIFLILMAFLSVFIERANFQGISIRDYVERVDAEFDVEFYYLNFSSKLVEDFYYAFLVLLFYLNHSIMELSKYFNMDWNDYTYGVLLLPMVSMGFDKLFSSSIFIEAIDKMILHGVYLSLPGFLYLDFSYFYFLFPFFIGFLLPFFYKRSFAHGVVSITYVYLYVSLVVIMIVSPIYNALAMLIFPLMISLTIFVLILSVRRVF